ncbi:Mucosa-associated lymphoid tissue lymphoma translocation protein 1-like protein, partial [Stegodyphus mimosarum]
MDLDLNILDLDYPTFYKIRSILDVKSTREDFLAAFPPGYFSTEFLFTMDVEAFKMSKTPAEYLLLHLGSRGVCVYHLIELFEAINLEKALVILKEPEPLEIVEQPPTRLELREGAKLLITCKATSYPPPEYHWFKDDEELYLQQDPDLSIASVKLNDSGIYRCKVISHNANTNENSCIVSEPAEIIVFSNETSVKSCAVSTLQVPKSSHFMTSEKNDCQFETTETPRDDKKAIKIEKQPYVNGKVPQGMILCLNCEVSSAYPVNYQWYRNGEIIDGQTSSKLELNYLYPDQNGDMKWQFFCKIFNEYHETFSETVVVELQDADETTPYFAEEKVAFMIANDTYDNLEELKKPAPDVADLAKLLSSMDFKIFAFRNLNYTEMKNAFHTFCQMLKPNSYVLFYYAGHGFESCGQTYLQPTDCSFESLLDESICSEYILKYMQDTKPAVNILLIDACRKLPFQFKETCEKECQSGKIFEAYMKNNTIYGYSTSKLCASHESDSEPNGFFAKHLKKYITQNKKIQDVLMKVQTDFAGDSQLKNIQSPVICTSLSAPRKLCDRLRKPTAVNGILSWADIKRPHAYKKFDLAKLKSTIVLAFQHHMDVFCNAFDVTVYIDTKEDAPLKILCDMEVNILFNSPDIKVIPIEGIHLRDTPLCLDARNILVRKEIHDVHKMQSPLLDGKLLLRFCMQDKQIATEFSMPVGKLAELKLSINQLKSNEETKIKAGKPKDLNLFNSVSSEVDNDFLDH